MRDNLTAAGIPAVVSGNVSVFHTEAGDDWLVLLEALEQPHRSGRVRAAALTPFVGRTAAELAAGGDALTDELSALFSRWATVLHRPRRRRAARGGRPPSRTCRPGCWAGSTANGSSPTCGTSARRCTPPRWRRASACPR